MSGNDARSMRLGPSDRIWAVVDPTHHSELIDILFETSLRDLELQFRGGLSCGRNLTLFADRGDAEAEARARMA